MKKIALLVAGGLLFAACGEDTMRQGQTPPGMFDDPRVVIAGQKDVPAGQRVQLFRVQVPEAESEQVVLTLVPPHKTQVNDPKLNGLDIVPLNNVYAIVQWGNGQQATAQAEIDLAQGLSLPIRGAYISVDVKNDTNPPTDAPNCGAFLSRGNFASGQARRTVVGTSGGAVITPGATSNTTDKMRIPPFARSLQAQTVTFAVAATYFVGFFDVSGNLITQTLVNSDATIIEVPSDAIQVQAATQNGGNVFQGVRFIFDLGI